MNNMPEISPRVPYDDSNPEGYLISDSEFVHNNFEACVWFLENANEIRKKLDSSADLLKGHKEHVLPAIKVIRERINQGNSEAVMAVVGMLEININAVIRKAESS